jgi:hypothetical protein
MPGAGFKNTIENSAKSDAKYIELFVDKSLFVQELIESSDKATLIIRPRRFGKSLNLEMAKEFLAAEFVLEDRTLKPKFGDTESAVYFKGGNKDISENKDKEIVTFEKLKIAEDEEFFNEHQGQYPVLHISFRNFQGTSFDKFRYGIKVAISETYQKHKYIAIAKFMTFYYDDESLKDIITNILKVSEE